MHPRFSQLIETLDPSLERLIAMLPVKSGTVPRNAPRSGIYLFTESGRHLYVGRSNRLGSRVRRHGAEASRHNVASFAFQLARRETGQTEASYRPEGSRAALSQEPGFTKAFSDAKARVRGMDVRFVEETDQLRQAFLEMYVHIALDTPFNDFDTH